MSWSGVSITMVRTQSLTVSPLGPIMGKAGFIVVRGSNGEASLRSVTATVVRLGKPT